MSEGKQDYGPALSGARIAEVWTQRDTLGIIQQAGAAPSPGGLC